MSNPSFGFTSTAEEVSDHFASSIKNKTILITGVSPSSISNPLIASLLPHSPGPLVLASRTPSNLNSVINNLPAHNTAIHAIHLDLSSLAAVREAAAQINALDLKIDIVIDNAAVMATQKFTETVDGFELQMGTNHLGHFLLFNLLRKGGSLADDVRVVSVSSIGHEFPGGDLNLEDPWFSGGKTYDPWHAYGKSKTANILFAVELAKRGVKAIAVHPGAIDTGLDRELPQEEKDTLHANYKFKTPSQGASGLLVAALDDKVDGKWGSYIVDCQFYEAKPYAKDPEIAAKLWKWSEEQVGEKFDF